LRFISALAALRYLTAKYTEILINLLIELFAKI
jgi:hypothetical protein